jgi:hypothetical protein
MTSLFRLFEHPLYHVDGPTYKWGALRFPTHWFQLQGSRKFVAREFNRYADCSFGADLLNPDDQTFADGFDFILSWKSKFEPGALANAGFLLAVEKSAKHVDVS